MASVVHRTLSLSTLSEKFPSLQMERLAIELHTLSSASLSTGLPTLCPSSLFDSLHLLTLLFPPRHASLTLHLSSLEHCFMLVERSTEQASQLQSQLEATMTEQSETAKTSATLMMQLVAQEEVVEEGGEALSLEESRQERVKGTAEAMVSELRVSMRRLRRPVYAALRGLEGVRAREWQQLAGVLARESTAWPVRALVEAVAALLSHTRGMREVLSRGASGWGGGGLVEGATLGALAVKGAMEVVYACLRGQSDFSICEAARSLELDDVPAEVIPS
ncbi:MAG: hypothetical protein SGPRY_002790 [Prymnesium sp.]